MIRLYVTYINHDTFVQTWADTVLEESNGTLTYMHNGQNVASFKVWLYWFWKGDVKQET